MKKILCLCFSAVLVLMCVACANQTTVMVSDPVGQADVTTAGVSDSETTGGEALDDALVCIRKGVGGKTDDGKDKGNDRELFCARKGDKGNDDQENDLYPAAARAG